MNASIEFLFLFLLIYVIKNEIGVEKFLKIVCGCTYVLCILGIQEFITGVNLFHKFQTLNAHIVQFVRSGSLRIMGPCGHALGYGLLLFILFTFCCIDIERNEINVLRRPILFLLIIINVFLTGSRSTLALFVLQVFILFLFSPPKTKKITVIFLLVVLAGVVGMVVIAPGSGISRYIMMQVTSVIDTILGTNYALAYGAESSRLNDSTVYRSALPKIFFLDYLNPILGRGVSRRNGFVIDGMNIISIDNFYVVQYIKYAYTGLVSYLWFVISSLLDVVKAWHKRKKTIYIVVFIGLLIYYINLWWVDSLQTLRYAYALFAVVYVYMIEEGHINSTKRKREASHSKYIK